MIIVFFLLFCLHKFIILNNRLVLFDDWRPLMKPVWSGWMRDEITDSRRAARALLIIFKSVLMRDNGR